MKIKNILKKTVAVVLSCSMLLSINPEVSKASTKPSIAPGTYDTGWDKNMEEMLTYVNENITPELYDKWHGEGKNCWNVSLSSTQIDEIKETTAKLTEGCSTDYEKGDAIFQYLKETFTYSLEKHSFEKKQGHCQRQSEWASLYFEAAGIRSWVVGSYQDNHAYNYIYYENAWHIVDFVNAPNFDTLREAETFSKGIVSDMFIPVYRDNRMRMVVQETNEDYNGEYYPTERGTLGLFKLQPWYVLCNGLRDYRMVYTQLEDMEVSVDGGEKVIATKEDWHNSLFMYMKYNSRYDRYEPYYKLYNKDTEDMYPDNLQKLSNSLANGHHKVDIVVHQYGVDNCNKKGETLSTFEFSYNIDIYDRTVRDPQFTMKAGEKKGTIEIEFIDGEKPDGFIVEYGRNNNNMATAEFPYSEKLTIEGLEKGKYYVIVYAYLDKSDGTRQISKKGAHKKLCYSPDNEAYYAPDNSFVTVDESAETITTPDKDKLFEEPENNATENDDATDEDTSGNKDVVDNSTDNNETSDNKNDGSKDNISKDDTDKNDTSENDSATKPQKKKEKLKGTDIKVLSAVKGGFKIIYFRSDNAKGYEIRYSTKKSMSKAKKIKVKSKYTTSKTVKGLKSKTTYYIQVRSFTKTNGKYKYSSWSSKGKVKTK